MDLGDQNFFGPHSSEYSQVTANLGLSMGDYPQGGSSDLHLQPADHYAQTRLASASPEYSLSPVTPKTSFNPALRLLDGPSMDTSLSVRNCIAFHTVEGS